MDDSVKLIYNMIKELNKYSESTLTHATYTIVESASSTLVNNIQITCSNGFY